MNVLTSSDWRERYGAWLFSILFFCIAGLGFVGPLGSALFTAVAGLLALPLARLDRSTMVGVGLFFAICLLAAVSMGWSRITPEIGGIQDYGDLEELTAVKLVGQAVFYGALVCAAARLSPRGAELALRVFAFSLTVLAVLLIVEGLSKASIYQAMEAMVGQPIRPDLAMRNVAQGGYVIALLVWPAAMLLRREGRNVLVLTLILGVIGVTVLFGADAPAGALAASFIAWVLVRLFGRPAVLALMGVGVAYALATPWLMQAASAGGLFDRMKAALPFSWDERMDIWTFASARVAEQPWLGWGLDASRTWPGKIPLHTHDAALQIWLELGVGGALLAAALVAFIFWTIGQAKEGRGFMAAATATAVTYITIGALSFGVWQEWWLALGAVAVCACLALKRAVAHWAEEENFGVAPSAGDAPSPTLP